MNSLRHTQQNDPDGTDRHEQSDASRGGSIAQRLAGTPLRALITVLTLLTLVTALVTLTGCEFENFKDQEYGPVGPGTGSPNDTTGTGGNDTTGSQAVTISISPLTISIQAGETVQFTPTVTGSSNTAVSWMMESGPGSVNATGLYQSPTAVSGQFEVATIQATSSADPTKTAAATIVVRPNGPPGDTAKNGEICFQRDVLPIVQSNCAKSGCHDVTTRQKGFAFVNYDGVLRGIDPGRPDNSEIYEKITETRSDKRMPPPPNTPLTSQQIATIRQWILEGARNTICPPEDVCDTGTVTYSGTLRPILDKYCIGCHSGTNPPKGIDLTRYADVRTVATDGRLRGVTARLPGYTPMPFGGDRLPQCEIDKIAAWINRGANND